MLGCSAQNMKAYLANTFSDEEGPLAEEGKTIIIHADKNKLLAICDFSRRLQQN